MDCLPLRIPIESILNRYSGIILTTHKPGHRHIGLVAARQEAGGLDIPKPTCEDIEEWEIEVEELSGRILVAPGQTYSEGETNHSWIRTRSTYSHFRL